jgi:hypothetical protein
MSEPPALTDAQRAALTRIQIEWTDSHWASDGTQGMRVLLETVAAYFLASGRAEGRLAGRVEGRAEAALGEAKP